MSNLDWREQGDRGIFLSPSAVSDLINADNIEQARIAFFDVSEAIGANGWIYPLALPVVKTVLAALPGCVGVGRDKSLGLLAQIAGSQVRSLHQVRQISEITVYSNFAYPLGTLFMESSSTMLSSPVIMSTYSAF